jgi:HEAT repeat protein
VIGSALISGRTASESMDFSLKCCKIPLRLYIPDAFLFTKISILGFGGHHACGVGRSFRPRVRGLGMVSPPARPTRKKLHYVSTPGGEAMTTINQLRKHLAELETGEDNVQRQALHSLRSLERRDWNAVPPMHVTSFLSAFRRQLLRDGKLAAVPRDIAAILGSMGTLSPAAVPPLSDLLQDGIPDCVREAAAGALGKLGSEAKSAAPRLVELASSPAAIARHAVCALGKIGWADQRVRTTLTNLWGAPAHSHDAAVQLAVALCKLQIHVAGVDAFLIGTLFDGQVEAIRIAAAEGLSWCDKNDGDIVPALLLAHTSDKSELVREMALTACTKLCESHENAIRACAKQLKDSTRAEAALRKTGAPAIPALIDALSAPDTGVRLKATRILSGFGETASAAVKKLTTALQDRNSDVRLATAK